MTHYRGERDYAHDSAPCLGVLVTNLGTPDAPTPSALRRYLGEFLADPRVVEFPRALWWLILHGIILRVRPRRAAHAYQSIWTEAGSPLLAHAREQTAALQAALSARLPGPVHVALAMRYGQPAIAEGLDALRRAGARRVLMLPLYPQYSASTTASTFDAVADELKTWRWIPELRMVTHYHDEPAYITALAESIRRYRAQHGTGNKLLFSFHGLPKRYLLEGDPYHCQCHKTARLVASALDLDTDEWQVVFQSRFGREEWLKPYADHTLRSLGEAGLSRVDVVCPGFSADCLETLEEMAVQNRTLFLDAGGQDYHYIPALNAEPDHIAMLAGLVERHVQGWPEAEPGYDSEAVVRAQHDSQQRARALGAER